MPVPRRSVPLVLVLLLLVLPANTLAGPTVGGAVHGAGIASRIDVRKDSGEQVIGGLYRVNYACIDCFLNFTIASGEVKVHQDGQEMTLTAGTWQIREFQGYFAYTYLGPWRNDFRIEGTGHVMQV